MILWYWKFHKLRKMEHTSVKNEFGDQVKEEPISIVPEPLLPEDYVFISNIKEEDSFKAFKFQPDSKFHDGTMNTVDNIKRWTVSSSVILPIDKTENGYNIEPADVSKDGVSPADLLKNEDTDKCSAGEPNEHTSQLAIIPNLTMNSPELTADSDALISSWSSNEQFESNSTGDSQVKTFNEPTSITDGNFTLKVGHALCRDVNAMGDTPEKIRGDSFCSKSFVDTVTLSSSEQTQRKMSKFSKVNQQCHTQSGGTLSKCHVSENTCSPAGSFIVHSGIHTGEKPYKCDVCNKTFTRSGILSRHQRVHTGEKPFQCEVCNKKFSQANSLKAHQRIHTGEKPFKCDVCDNEFNDLSCFRRHQRIHTGEKPYKCDICNMTFTQSSDVKIHRRIHTGERSYKCDVCNKTFIRPCHLIEHQRIHTGKKPFQCKVCKKKFSRANSLKAHQRIHTGEKPYKCDVCYKTFTHFNTLKTHQRVHTGEKPFKCEICGKEFNQAPGLKTHQRTHTCEKPYKCDDCNKEFTTSSSLSKHRQRIHKEEKPNKCDA